MDSGKSGAKEIDNGIALPTYLCSEGREKYRKISQLHVENKPVECYVSFLFPRRKAEASLCLCRFWSGFRDELHMSMRMRTVQGIYASSISYYICIVSDHSRRVAEVD